MANANIAKGFRLYKVASGLTPQLEYAELNATVAAGDPLIWSSGLLGIHTAAADEKIVGIAQAAGVSGDKIPYIPVQENQIWAIQASTYTEATHRGGVYELAGTTGVFYVNVAGTTKPMVRIVGKLPPPALNNATGTYATVLVTIVADSYGRSGTVTV